MKFPFSVIVVESVSFCLCGFLSPAVDLNLCLHLLAVYNQINVYYTQDQIRLKRLFKEHRRKYLTPKPSEGMGN